MRWGRKEEERGERKEEKGGGGKRKCGVNEKNGSHYEASELIPCIFVCLYLEIADLFGTDYCFFVFVL